MEQATNLIEAIKLLQKARVEFAGGPWAIWNKLDNAVNHLDKQLASVLSSEN